MWKDIEPFIVSSIASYLQPTDLCRLRTLNRFYHSEITRYLLSVYKKICIEDFVCPKCGCFFNSEEITYRDYYDVLYGNVEEIESQRMILIQHYLGETAIRKTILCDDCDLEEDEDPERGLITFPFQGSKTYQLYILRNPYPYQWAIITTKVNGELRWNQYRCFIPIVPIYELVEMVSEYEEQEDQYMEDEDDEEDEYENEYDNEEEEYDEED